MADAPELRVSSIKFVAGPTPHSPPLEIEASPVVVLVGPNNSGKSIALSELMANALHGSEPAGRVIREVSISVPEDPRAAASLLEEVAVDPPAPSARAKGVFWIPNADRQGSRSVRVADLLHALKVRDLEWVRRLLIPILSVRLDGRTRFNLCDDQPAGDLQAPPENHLASLFRDDRSRKEAREVIHDAFGLFFVIDPTNLGQLRIRLSTKPPRRLADEQSLDSRARAFHASARHIREFSDGVQAYTGLISAVMSRRYRLMLIDEPDAFLHPPLAGRLGAALTRMAVTQGASVVCATHSASFLLGCVTRASVVTIVRLTYEQGVASARSLSSEQIKVLVQHPLLRSTNALGALFHKAAVITESDSDRALYQEINRRLVDVGRGIDDAVFMNAQNWQTTALMAEPLRRVGVPAAIVIDIDALCSESEWERFYRVAALDEASIEVIDRQRRQVAKELQDRSLALGDAKAYKKRGLSVLAPKSRAAAEEFLSRLAELGIFVVPVGELEQWLRSLGGSTTKRGWIVRTMNLLGSDPDSATYARPTDDDVWAFIDLVAAWTQDPARTGMPE